MELQCNACGATYVDVLPDGMQYFHACPPLALPELKAALDAGTVSLTKRQAAQLAAIEQTPALPTIDPAALSPADAYLAALTIERPNKRDENVRIVGKTNDGQLIVVAKLEGAGVTELG